MLFRSLLITSVLLWCASVANAGEKLKPNQIIDKAIKAVGGKSAIEKSKATFVKDSGTYYGMGEGLPYTGVYSFQLPDKMRMEIEGVFIIVLNGKKGWTSAMGETKAMPEKELAVQRKSMHTHAVTSLLPFINRKGYKFTALANVKVNGADSVGLQVSKKGYDDVKLYFDAKTFLMTKVSHKAILTDKDFKEVTQDAYYTAYKKFDGVMVATKAEVKHNGERFLVMNITEFRPMREFDPKTFAKP